MKKIVLTGGGTAGHVTPNIALIDKLRESGEYEIEYIGSYTGIEKELIEKIGVPYHGISSGKLRRYFDLKNLSDPFRVIKGMKEAKKLLKEIRPDVVFSKGGFVTVPVVRAAKKLKIPAIIHESDMTPGLANRLSIPAAWKVCCNFAETVEMLPKDKAVLTGTPLRKELLEGSRIKGYDFCGFRDDKPVIMVVGGSTGAAAINEAVRNLLPTLLKKYQVLHICGKGKMDDSFNNIEGYRQFAYISAELKDCFAMADLVISRAGANAISELLALKKPNILIPLTAAASRGDQILNAESFERNGYSKVLYEENVTNETLLCAINEVFENWQTYVDAMGKNPSQDATGIIFGLIEEAASQKDKAAK